MNGLIQFFCLRGISYRSEVSHAVKLRKTLHRKLTRVKHPLFGSCALKNEIKFSAFKRTVLNSAVEPVKNIADASADIVIVSSVGTQHQLKQAIEAGAKDFVQKPLNAEQVENIIKIRFEGR